MNICILCHLSEKEKIEREGNNSNKSKEGERERGGYMSTAHIATNLLNNKQLLELKEERREEVQRERKRESMAFLKQGFKWSNLSLFT